MADGDLRGKNGDGVALDAAQLLRSVAEQLKLPLTVIARQAELGQTLELHGSPISDAVDLAVMRSQAQMALGLVDSYLLGLQLMQGQQRLTLEPVSVSSLLVEVAHELRGLARQYDVDVELSIAGRYEPVMAHRRGLKAALLSLGYTLIGARPEGARRRLLLAAHRTASGINAGMYGQFDGLHAGAWRKALELCGKASRPFGTLSGDSGAGLFVAETILRAMETGLRVGKHSNNYGLATTLQPSQQLRLV
jgi:hypothetical protein